MPSVPLPQGIDKVAVPPVPPTVPGVLQRLEAIQATFPDLPPNAFRIFTTGSGG